MDNQKSLDDLPEFFSVAILAEILGISRATAYRMAGQGCLPCLRVGKRIILSREHLRRWLDRKLEVS